MSNIFGTTQDTPFCGDKHLYFSNKNLKHGLR